MQLCKKSKAYPLFQVPGHNVPPAANSLQADVKSHHRHNLASGLRFRVANGSHALFWLRGRQEWSIWSGYNNSLMWLFKDKLEDVDVWLGRDAET